MDQTALQLLSAMQAPMPWSVEVKRRRSMPARYVSRMRIETYFGAYVVGGRAL